MFFFLSEDNKSGSSKLSYRVFRIKFVEERSPFVFPFNAGQLARLTQLVVSGPWLIVPNERNCHCCIVTWTRKIKWRSATTSSTWLSIVAPLDYRVDFAYLFKGGHNCENTQRFNALRNSGRPDEPHLPWNSSVSSHASLRSSKCATSWRYFLLRPYEWRKIH